MNPLCKTSLTSLNSLLLHSVLLFCHTKNNKRDSYHTLPSVWGGVYNRHSNTGWIEQFTHKYQFSTINYLDIFKLKWNICVSVPSPVKTPAFTPTPFPMLLTTKRRHFSNLGLSTNATSSDKPLVLTKNNPFSYSSLSAYSILSSSWHVFSFSMFF